MQQEFIGLITKKVLRMTYGFKSEVLAEKVFTDSILDQMGLTREEYKEIRAFNLEQSAFIKREIIPKLRGLPRA